jgi:hypothetical protein
LRKCYKKITSKISLEVIGTTVGDIDLTSNQMMDFLEFFIEEMSQKKTSKFL